MITEEQAEAWRPGIPGWSADILPFYEMIADELPDGATFVEIGAAHGRSVLYLAEQLVERGKLGVKLYAVDWWLGPDFRSQLLRTLCGSRLGGNGITPAMIDLVKPIAFEGVRAARLFDDGSVWGVFEDSDHSYTGVLRTLEAWTPKIATTGGIIAGHDYQPKDWPGVVAAVDEYFGAVEHPTRTVWMRRDPVQAGRPSPRTKREGEP